MNTKTLLIYSLVLALAAVEILFLRRRIESKVQAGAMTRVVANKQLSYQWRLLTWLTVIFLVGGIGSLINKL